MAEIEIFLQGSGIPKIVLARVPETERVASIIRVAQENGLQLAQDKTPYVFVENSDEPLNLESQLDAVGILPRTRVHVHTCRQVRVTVNFGGDSKSHPFAPSTTIQRVKKWADKQFGLSEVDATEHALQICNSTTRPSEDIHIGTLVSAPVCTLCFDLVPKQRVEG